MKVIIAGPRHCVSYDLVVALMEEAARLKQIVPTRVVSGRAAGVDMLGERWARANGLEVMPFPIEKFSEYGRSAGWRRNQQMAACGDALAALWDGQSDGTKMMVEEMVRLGKPIYVKTIDPP